MLMRIKDPILKTDFFTQPVTPQMDWDDLRKAKQRCENECAHFDANLSGCSFGLLPSLYCEKFDRIKKEVNYFSRNTGRGLK